jgi:cell division septum initiation protein DivIVA
MTQNEVASVTTLINTLCLKVNEAKSREVTFRNHIKSLNTKASLLRRRYEAAKGTMLNNASELESAIQKKAYARARTMVKDQKKKASDMAFEFYE